ncbi:hypothetical protein [Limosilactobacillus fastidiosus]|uniref:Uncharacterized protein n=2 Tax=Limosilactobacillus fastidiosus TaxID=2759855 RepID=A0A7W3TZA6_9LACO|nr:hypothetical protein [Limosilactobacillus fastidiosus]MBB1063294.1 hypothetical protein [Limosilactobacillus fastidiosus]MBB1086066.1 hypothetical protein [Limosilactobacillus fastidiosus]MCD7084604.1 hypothetical protein [Limosilactobacillus fastidiosus]MCD7086285.1 hypothetical protein [Limosilactobacillus fastidiosus]MCD7114492.1 hypothetical protein [Limosilactobacillus fastidiosus]
MSKMKKLFQDHKRLIEKIIGVVVVLVLVIAGYNIYQHHQNTEAKKAITKVCKSTPPLAGMFSDYQIIDVNAHKKIVDFQMNEELSNALKSNINQYVDDHVSTLNRLFGDTEEHSDNEGNLSITGTEVQPICYAIASNKTFVKKYGKGWTVKVYNAQGKLQYVYQDDKFLQKPELYLESVIEKGAEEHDENATEITEAVLNAVGNKNNE